ncbi:MAG: hypothetical protein DRG78_13500 [Epsilonproteobacteria bacterium]|nr:MAG: hypothetical protein DRG78_13500 [Campylobacterota bacterium]
MKFFTKIILIVLFLSATLFSKDIARVTGLNGKAYIDRDGVKIELTLGASLQEKDTIVTKDKAKVQIIFEDETIVTVGKNSNFSIDEYLYEAKEEPVAKFGILRGAMRTITGKIGEIAPDKFSVKTKTSTIGIRGTNFAIIERVDGSHLVYCTYGAISVSVSGNEIIVGQGFYASVALSGEIELNEFTSKELREMQESNFAEGKKKKIRVSKDADVADDGQLDFTTDNESAIVVKDTTAQTQDATQREDNEPEPEPEPEPPTPHQIVMSGWMVNSDGSEHYSRRVGLDFISDGSLFDSANSWVEDASQGAAGETAEWKYTISDTPLTYTSREEFSTTFSSVVVSGGNFSNARITAGTQPNSFIATGDDLKNDDYMSWGSWSISLLYNDDYAGAKDQTRDVYGLWVAGEPTDAAVVDALTGNAVSYDGKYRAIDFVNSNTIVNGTADMTVDFGADTATLNIDYDSGRTFDMYITGNSMNGTQGGGEDGVADGTFYGPDGDSVGGNFKTTFDDGAAVEIKGVYQVDK